MKKILIECCKECIYCAQYDNGSATCSHPQLYIEIDRGITQAVEVPTDGAIHPDCPLPDDLPESKGSERDLLISYTRWLALNELYVDRYIKEVEPYFPKQSKSDDWIPASRIRDKIKTYELHFNIIKDQQSSIFKEEGETCKRVIGVLKSLLPAVPQEEKGEK